MARLKDKDIEYLYSHGPIIERLPVWLLGFYLLVMEEIWKDVEGYEGLYQVSNKARVRSKNTILSPEISNKGYLMVGMRKPGKHQLKTIHRMMGIAFIPNPEPLIYDCINHKDGNKLNNDLDNLEWCTKSMNNKHAYATGLKIPKWTDKHGEEHPRSKKVFQFDRLGKFIKEHINSRIASNETGANYKHISAVTKGKRLTAGGYLWSYESSLSKI